MGGFLEVAFKIFFIAIFVIGLINIIRAYLLLKAEMKYRRDLE